MFFVSLSLWLSIGNKLVPPQLKNTLFVSSYSLLTAIFSAHQIQAPLMVIHGANDPRVKQAESDQIVAAVRNNNTDVKYLLAPDEGHGFRKETNKLAVAAAIERFLARHLQGRYQESISPEVEEKLEALTVDIDTIEVSQ